MKRKSIFFHHFKEVVGDNALADSTAWKWVHEFTHWLELTEDLPRSEHPIFAKTSENIARVEALFIKGRQRTAEKILNHTIFSNNMTKEW